MREFEVFVCLLVSTIGSITSWPVCPPSDTIFPCDCDNTSGQFVCGKSISTNLVLKQIFQESSRQLKHSLKDKTILFNKFLFENSIVTHLESYTLDALAFTEILIARNDYLETIDENAFNSTYNITDKVHFESNPSIGGDRTAVIQFFRVLSRFTNASDIEVVDCGLTFIPDNAFGLFDGVQNRLQRVSFAKNRIKIVGSFAFTNLPNIKYISLQKNLIESLSHLSLVFSDSSEHLILDLSKNQLTSSSFDSEALASIKRPFDLQLSDNSITHLNETVFKYLFKKSIFIKLWRNPINCSDCRMKWTSNVKLCGISNNTISYSQRIEFQCKLFKENFNRCQNDTYSGADELLDNPLPCPLISNSFNYVLSNSLYIMCSVLFLKFLN